MAAHLETLPPFVGDGRLHVDRVEVYYSIEGDPRARRFTADLKPDDRVAAIFFDRDDVLRCLGCVHTPDMRGYAADTEAIDLPNSRIEILDERLEQHSAKEVYVHKKDCTWIYVR